MSAPMMRPRLGCTTRDVILALVPEKPESANVVATGSQISTRPATPPQLVALPPMATFPSE